MMTMWILPPVPAIRELKFGEVRQMAPAWSVVGGGGGGGVVQAPDATTAASACSGAERRPSSTAKTSRTYDSLPSASAIPLKRATAGDQLLMSPARAPVESPYARSRAAAARMFDDASRRAESTATPASRAPSANRSPRS